MASLKRELFSGVFYTAIAKYSGILISLVVAGVLSRLIAPEEFGVITVATVVISFFSVFSDLGIAPAVVQQQDLTDEDLSGLFSFSCWTGLALGGLFFLSSWLIASFYEDQALVPIIQLLSLNLFFASANIIPNALLFKAKNFKFIAWRTLGIQVAGGVIAIAVALLGGGIYALVVNPILSSLLLFVVSYRKYPQKLKFSWGIVPLRKIFRFSAYQFLFNIICFFSRNLDKLLIGKHLGMTLLGYYDKSYRLMMLPLQNITYVITPVMHPVFSGLQNDKPKMIASYGKIVRFLALIGLPLSATLWFTAKEITLVIFGDQWLPSVPVFQILSLSVGIQIILSTSGAIFQAANDTKNLFVTGLISAVLNVTGMCIGIFYFKTLEAVAWGICISFTLSFLQSYWVMYRVTFKQGMLQFWKQFVSPAALSVLIAGVLWRVSAWLDSSPRLISLIVKGMIALTVWVVYMQMSGEYDIWGKTRGMVATLRNKLNR